MWQGYLDSKDRVWLDFERGNHPHFPFLSIIQLILTSTLDVQPSLNNELNTRNDFVEELNLLSDKLDHENELMLGILKTKAAEAKEAQIDAAKVFISSHYVRLFFLTLFCFLFHRNPPRSKYMLNIVKYINKPLQKTYPPPPLLLPLSRYFRSSTPLHFLSK